MKTVRNFLNMKQQNEKIVMMTAYDFPTAQYAEKAGVDVILVGDSLGMVVLGYDSTIRVTIDDMVHHTKAVRNGAQDTFIVTDLPFMSYHCSMEETMKSVRKIMQEGRANAVKLEGGSDDVLTLVDKLSHAGVPVVGHLGLTPQSVEVFGGYFVQAKEIESAKKLIKQAKQLEQNGAVMIVLECVPHQVTAIVQKECKIPIIGIGAGASCDGQVLVFHDIVQFGSHKLPKFVKSYADLGVEVEQAISHYVEEVKEQSFPQEKHHFSLKEEFVEGLYGGEKK
ncbi:MAG TPA: 3-methyl-2-oxobutanoate hydroxymethyltransferase [Massilibacterium sp.]|nr:3-methyl-2-oxobutanoate hydroxymethyltransferase [Massilibacterium sp.]